MSVKEKLQEPRNSSGLGNHSVYAASKMSVHHWISNKSQSPNFSTCEICRQQLLEVISKLRHWHSKVGCCTHTGNDSCTVVCMAQGDKEKHLPDWVFIRKKYSHILKVKSMLGGACHYSHIITSSMDTAYYKMAVCSVYIAKKHLQAW